MKVRKLFFYADVLSISNVFEFLESVCVYVLVNRNRACNYTDWL